MFSYILEGRDTRLALRWQGSQLQAHPLGPTHVLHLHERHLQAMHVQSAVNSFRVAFEMTFELVRFRTRLARSPSPCA